MWGRTVTITDCDDFTKEYYRSKYGIGTCAGPALLHPHCSCLHFIYQTLGGSKSKREQELLDSWLFCWCSARGGLTRDTWRMELAREASGSLAGFGACGISHSSGRSPVWLGGVRGRLGGAGSAALSSFHSCFKCFSFFFLSEDFTPVQYKVPEAPEPPRLLPPYHGFGSEEDSLRSCHGQLRKPPHKDFHKFMDKDRLDEL